MFTEEVSRPVKGYEGLYKIYPSGIVFPSRNIIVTKTGVTRKIIRFRSLGWKSDENGYPYVTLNKDGKRTKHYVHMLVAETFVRNPHNKPCVTQLDDLQKWDISASNLKWTNPGDDDEWLPQTPYKSWRNVIVMKM